MGTMFTVHRWVPPSLCESDSRVVCPVLDCLVEEKQGHIAVSLVEGQKDNRGNRACLI